MSEGASTSSDASQNLFVSQGTPSPHTHTPQAGQEGACLDWGATGGSPPGAASPRRTPHWASHARSSRGKNIYSLPLLCTTSCTTAPTQHRTCAAPLARRCPPSTSALRAPPDMGRVQTVRSARAHACDGRVPCTQSGARCVNHCNRPSKRIAVGRVSIAPLTSSC